MRPGLRHAWLLAAALAWAPPAFADTPADTADDDGQGLPATLLLGGLLSESRVLYPLQVGDWRAVSEQRFPDQRYGVAVRYIDGERWLDLYFYPGGPQAPELLAQVARVERENIGAAARESDRGIRLGELQEIGLAGEAQVPAWRLGLEYPGEQRASAMLLFARNLYLVKARASAPPPATPASLLAEVQAFMEVVAAQVRIASTGECWLPERLEVVDALPDPAAPQVFASYRDPGKATAAVVTAAGVQVARAEAARAQGLATELAAALYPGCVAPEAIEPEVPSHMREIRIEYRIPAADDSDRRSPPVGRPRPPLRGTG